MNERTRLTVVMVIAAIILVGWTPLLRFIERQTGYALIPPPPATQPADEPAPQSPTNAPTTSLAPSPPPTTQPGALAVALPTTQPAAVVNIGSGLWQDKTYAMALRVNPAGGGLDGVQLNNFPDAIGTQEAYRFQFPYDNDVHTLPLSTRSVTIDGVVKDLGGSAWTVAARGENSVTLTLDVADVNGPVVTLAKTFTVEPRGEGGGQGPQGYETKFTSSVINRTTRPLIVSTVLNGPTFSASEQIRGGDRSVVAGYAGKNDVILRHDAVEGFSGSTTTKDFTTYENLPLLWIGASGNYFNGIVRPTGNWAKSASAFALNPDADGQHRKVVITLTSDTATLAPGATLAHDARVYFGPRKRDVLKNPYYAANNVGYEHTLETTGSCAFCTFQWLVDILMGLLGFFHFVTRDWGLAIIVLVFVVRALLHPITKRAQINMAGMAKMGPEIEKIKKRHANDKEAMNRAMMDFYKTQGATPILGCLPMFLQMPIWIALYSGLGSTFELRQAPFLYGFTWIKDLSQPDHLIHFSQPLTLFFLHFDGLNVIPFLLAAAFFLQQKFTPKPPASTPEQVQQQKMMQWMTLLFPVMLYSSPSGLNLYILTSTTFGIIESRIIRKHIKEREALEATGPTFVDGEVVDDDRNRTKRTTTPAPTGGLAGLWKRAQDYAEKARDDAEKRARQQKRR